MFTEGSSYVSRMGSTLISFCSSRLLQTSLICSSSSSFPYHKIALLMYCVDSVTDLLFTDIILINDAMYMFLNSRYVTLNMH
jgi:hypothetical protein